MTTSRFQIGETDFLLDGMPHRIISGAMHYPRVHPDQWRDRIRKARLMGLNAIETYVAWNAHEPVRGEWSQTGAVDLGRFLDLIAEEGLHAIVRPGPYVCAEWHNGGLPTWLTADPSMKLRSSDPRYLAAVSDYLARVNEILVPRQIDQGGVGHPRADRERVRRVRLRQGLPRRTHPAHAGCRHHGPAHPGRPAHPAHARERGARGTAQDGLVRLAHHRAPRDAARASAHRTADVHGVLVRLVRPLGREAPHDRLRRQRGRPRHAAGRRGIRQHLHGARRHELRSDRGRERLGPLPADGDLVRLRLADQRVRRHHREVPRVPRGDRQARTGARRAAARAARRAGVRGRARERRRPAAPRRDRARHVRCAAVDGRTRSRHRARRVRGIPRRHRCGRAPDRAGVRRGARLRAGCTSTTGQPASCSAPCARTRSRSRPAASCACSSKRPDASTTTPRSASPRA